MRFNPRIVATGVGRTEGPCIRPDGELLFTSMDQGLIYRVRAGKAEPFADVQGSPNGIADALDGKLYVTQSSGRHNAATKKPLETGGIQVVDRYGKVDWLTRDPIAPNDICFGPDGLVYFTDPTRHKAGQSRRSDSRLFRVESSSGECELLRSIAWYANGIAFGPDAALYYADDIYGSTAQTRIVRIPLDNGKLGKEETYFPLVTGAPDGFCFDAAGNVVTTALPSDRQTLAQVQVYSPSGKLIDTIEAPDEKQRYTNVAIGPDRVLYITDALGGQVLAVDDYPHLPLLLYPHRT